jgi:hypothetical protein
VLYIYFYKYLNALDTNVVCLFVYSLSLSLSLSLSHFSPIKEERYCQAVKSLEFDRQLGPYNLSQYGDWKHLSNFITKSVIERIGILYLTTSRALHATVWYIPLGISLILLLVFGGLAFFIFKLHSSLLLQLILGYFSFEIAWCVGCFMDTGCWKLRENEKLQQVKVVSCCVVYLYSSIFVSNATHQLYIVWGNGTVRRDNLPLMSRSSICQ